MGWRSRYYDYDSYPRYPKSVSREAKGGIRSQTQRGSFGKSWWAKRWIEVLESFNIGARLSRGRSYARSGQVLSIEIQKGTVLSSVQGSRPTPYRIKIMVRQLKPAQRRDLGEALSREAIFAAKLLAGEMPADIETVFRQAGLSLFPETVDDLDTDCSCPDWSNPCKHIAAVYYLLGEEFDRDPFLILKLRGIDREELVKLIGSESPKGEPKGKKRNVRGTKTEEPPCPVETPMEPPSEPLATDTGPFWKGTGVAEDWGRVQQPLVTAALPKRLGNFPFWRGQTPLIDRLAATYRKASEEGMNAFLGHRRSV